MELYFTCPHNGPTEDLCLSLSRYNNAICITCILKKLSTLDRENAPLKLYSSSIALESVHLMYKDLSRDTWSKNSHVLASVSEAVFNYLLNAIIRGGTRSVDDSEGTVAALETSLFSVASAFFRHQLEVVGPEALEESLQKFFFVPLLGKLLKTHGIDAFAHGVGLSLLSGAINLTNDLVENLRWNESQKSMDETKSPTLHLCTENQCTSIIQIVTAAVASTEESVSFTGCNLLRGIFTPVVVRSSFSLEVSSPVGPMAGMKPQQRDDALWITQRPSLSWSYAENKNVSVNYFTALRQTLSSIKSTSPDLDIVIMLSLERAVSTQLRQALMSLATMLVLVSSRANFQQWPRWLLEIPDAEFEPLTREVLSLTPVGSSAMAAMPMDVRGYLSSKMLRSQNTDSSDLGEKPQVMIDPDVFCAAVLNECVMRALRMALMSSEPSVQLEAMAFSEALVLRGGFKAAQTFLLGRSAQAICEIQSPFDISEHKKRPSTDQSQIPSFATSRVVPPFPLRVQPIPIIIRASIDSALETILTAADSQSRDEGSKFIARQRVIFAGCVVLRAALAGPGLLCNTIAHLLSYIKVDGKDEDSHPQLKTETINAVYSTIRVVLSLSETMRDAFPKLPPFVRNSYYVLTSSLYSVFTTLWGQHLIGSQLLIEKLSRRWSYLKDNVSTSKLTTRLMTVVDNLMNEGLIWSDTIRRSNIVSTDGLSPLVGKAEQLEAKGGNIGFESKFEEIFSYFSEPIMNFIGLTLVKEVGSKEDFQGISPVLLGPAIEAVRELQASKLVDEFVCSKSLKRDAEVPSGKGLWMEIRNAIERHTPVLLSKEYWGWPELQYISQDRRLKIALEDQVRATTVGEALVIKEITGKLDRLFASISHVIASVKDRNLTKCAEVATSVFNLSNDPMSRTILIDFRVFSVKAKETVVRKVYSEPSVEWEACVEAFSILQKAVDIFTKSNALTQILLEDSEPGDYAIRRFDGFLEDYRQILRSIATYVRNCSDTVLVQRKLEMGACIGRSLESLVDQQLEYRKVGVFRVLEVNPTFSVCLQSLIEILTVSKSKDWCDCAASLISLFEPLPRAEYSPYLSATVPTNYWSNLLQAAFCYILDQSFQSKLQTDINIDYPHFHQNAREEDDGKFLKFAIARLVPPAIDKNVKRTINKAVLQIQESAEQAGSEYVYEDTLEEVVSELPFVITRRLSLGFLLLQCLKSLGTSEKEKENLKVALYEMSESLLSLWNYLITLSSTSARIASSSLSWSALWISVEIHTVVSETFGNFSSQLDVDNETWLSHALTSHRFTQAVASLMAVKRPPFYSHEVALSSLEEIECNSFHVIWAGWFWRNTSFSQVCLQYAWVMRPSVYQKKWEEQQHGSSQEAMPLFTIEELSVWQGVVDHATQEGVDITSFSEKSLPEEEKTVILKSRISTIDSLSMQIAAVCLSMTESSYERLEYKNVMNLSRVTLSQYDSAFIHLCTAFDNSYDEPVTSDKASILVQKIVQQLIEPVALQSASGMELIFSTAVVAWTAVVRLRKNSINPESSELSSITNSKEGKSMSFLGKDNTELRCSETKVSTLQKLEALTSLLLFSRILSLCRKDHGVVLLTQHSDAFASVMSILTVEVFGWCSASHQESLRNTINTQMLVDILSPSLSIKKAVDIRRDSDKAETRESENDNESSSSSRRSKLPSPERKKVKLAESRELKLSSRTAYPCQSSVLISKCLLDLASTLIHLVRPVSMKALYTVSGLFKSFEGCSDFDPLILGQQHFLTHEASDTRSDFARVSLTMYILKVIEASSSLEVEMAIALTCLIDLFSDREEGEEVNIASLKTEEDSNVGRFAANYKTLLNILDEKGDANRTSETSRRTRITVIPDSLFTLLNKTRDHDGVEVMKDAIERNNRSPLLRRLIAHNLVSDNVFGTSPGEALKTAIESWLSDDVMKILHRKLLTSLGTLQFKETWTHPNWTFVAPLCCTFLLFSEDNGLKVLATENQDPVTLDISEFYAFSRIVCMKYLDLSVPTPIASDAAMAAVLTATTILQNSTDVGVASIVVLVRAILRLSHHFCNDMQLYDDYKAKATKKRIGICGMCLTVLLNYHSIHSTISTQVFSNGRTLLWAEHGDDDHLKYLSLIATGYQDDSRFNFWHGEITSTIQGMTHRIFKLCSPITTNAILGTLPVPKVKGEEVTIEERKDIQSSHADIFLSTINIKDLSAISSLFASLIFGAFGLSWMDAWSYTNPVGKPHICAFLEAAHPRIGRGRSPLWQALLKYLPLFAKNSAKGEISTWAEQVAINKEFLLFAPHVEVVDAVIEESMAFIVSRFATRGGTKPVKSAKARTPGSKPQSFGLQLIDLLKVLLKPVVLSEASSKELELPTLINCIGSIPLTGLFAWIRAEFILYACEAYRIRVKDSSPQHETQLCFTKAKISTSLLQLMAVLSLDSVLDYVFKNSTSLEAPNTEESTIKSKGKNKEQVELNIPSGLALVIIQCIYVSRRLLRQIRLLGLSGSKKQFCPASVISGSCCLCIRHEELNVKELENAVEEVVSAFQKMVTI